MVKTAMKNDWKSLGLDAAVIILLTLVVYLPAMRCGFVFDDYPLIVDNGIVKASDGLYRFWLTTEAPDYYPLTSSLWWLEWRLWHANPIGYHVVNVFLHALNAVLVWLLLRRLKIPGAWATGLVFAVHPVNVATVAWVVEQKNTLSMLFYTVAILLYLRFYENGRWNSYGLALAAFLLALLSKTAVVMLPLVLLGCVWWMRGRVQRKDFLYTLPFFALSLVSGLVTIWFQNNRALEGHAARTVDFATRLAAAGWVPWFYLYKILLPFNLTVVYSRWQVDASHWVSFVPGIILVGCLTLFWRYRATWGRPFLFGLGYFVATLFPVLGFFDQGFYRFSLVADQWQYYSMVGVIALIVAAGVRICRHMSDNGQYWFKAVGVVVLTMFAFGTWMRSSVYANNLTLWRDNVTKNPKAWLAQYHLGVALGQVGRLHEATQCFGEALRIKPDDPETRYNLGVALFRLGRVPEAMAQWERALRLNPDDVAAHYNLANALKETGKIEEAITHYEQALRIQPDFAKAHYNLAVALRRAGEVANSTEHCRRAIDLAIAQGDTELANAARMQLKLYEGNSPFQEKP